VEVLGGKSIPCPACQAVGTVRAPQAVVANGLLAAKPRLINA
jgi:hypothetical protein